MLLSLFALSAACRTPPQLLRGQSTGFNSGESRCNPVAYILSSISNLIHMTIPHALENPFSAHHLHGVFDESPVLAHCGCEKWSLVAYFKQNDISLDMLRK
ncbi:hypothetical protein B0H19DRAFT_1073818 [Mycena capillaripes]|nr:hypothetical protein B0H19DRAFT_1073818 [Mycena capillaripes]